MRTIKHDLKKYFRTKNRLTALINHMDSVMEETFFNRWLQSCDLDPDQKYQQLPYWIELDPFYAKNKDADLDQYRCEVVQGYWDIERDQIRAIEGIEYRYAWSIPFNGEEELQTKDGKSVFLYHGENFIRIWEPVN